MGLVDVRKVRDGRQRRLAFVVDAFADDNDDGGNDLVRTPFPLIREYANLKKEGIGFEMKVIRLLTMPFAIRSSPCFDKAIIQ